MSDMKSGDTYKCDQCGMELKVTTPCTCEGDDPKVTCCGQTVKRRSA